MSKHQLGDGPIEDQHHEAMNIIASVLDETFNPSGKKEVGFVLLVFPYGDTEGRCNFISNGANRADVVTLFKEMIARFEGQPEMKGNA